MKEVFLILKNEQFKKSDIDVIIDMNNSIEILVIENGVRMCVFFA